MRSRLALALLLIAAAVAAPSASAEVVPPAPAIRLLNVWLDLQVVAMLYPDATSGDFAARLPEVALQLGQPAVIIRQGSRASDVRQYRVGTVLVLTTAPADVLVLLTRSRTGAIYELMDDAAGRLKLFRVRL